MGNNFLKTLESIPSLLYLTIILCATFGGVFGGVVLSPWFTWTGNALSDIGVYGSGFIAATVFNGGLIIGGFTTVLLSLRYYRLYQQHWGTSIGIKILTLAGLSLISIGVFTEESPPFHFIASVLFFVLVPFSMWFFSIGLLKAPETKTFGIISVLLPFVSVFAWGIPYYDGVAIPEIISSFASWFWVILLVYTSTKAQQSISL